MSRDEALALVDHWRAAGWLGTLDRAFARFIAAESADAPGSVLIAAALASHQLGRSHICLDLDALASDPHLTLGLVEREPLDVAFDRLPDSLTAGCVGDGPGTTPLVRDGHRLYLRRYWHYELAIADAVRARTGTDIAIPDDIEDPQQRACEVARRSLLTIVTGGPGTGKTTTVERILERLRQDAEHELHYALAAPTGKAAARLDPQATTLHRLLGSRPGSRRFRHGPDAPLPHDVVVVDEASMVDVELMAQLFAALRDDARLVLLGDKDQLASVEAGSVLADLCDAGGAHVVRLDYSWRFGDHPGIGALAGAVNRGDITAFERAFETHDEIEQARLDDAAEFAAGFQPYLEAARSGADAATARRALDALQGFQVLCALREGPWGVAGLNARIERVLGIEHGEEWYPGRPVMVTRNDYALGLFNGDIGVTLADGDSMRVWFDTGGELKSFVPARLPETETSFALTVHKSQGSEFEHTTLVLPDQDSPVLTRELLYTAITRARSKFSLLAPGDGGGWRAALGRETLRSSGLRDRLV